MSTLSVLWQGGDVVLVNKPAGLLSIPGRDPTDIQTVPLQLQALLKLQDVPRICHRLDKDTSGVMALALTKAAQAAVSSQFEHHSVRKTYLALCHGAFLGLQVMDAPLGPDVDAPRDSKARQGSREDGKNARTVGVGLWTNGSISVVAARPSTGRTHQVRAHLAHAGHPLLGDTLYNGPSGPRPMLHALFLSLRVAGKDLSQGAPLPPDFTAFLPPAVAVALDPAAVDSLTTQAVRTGKASPPITG